jgi:hypothetical protein
MLHSMDIVATVGPDSPALRAGVRSPLGASSAGQVLATRAFGMGAGPNAQTLPRTDSTTLVLVDRRTGTADTLAVLKSRPSRIHTQGTVERITAIEITTNPLAAGELGLVFPDGWVAIARLDPYRVEWLAPGGQRVAGAPLPFAATRVTDEEKRAVLQREADARGTEPRDPDSVRDWPEHVPPFLAGALLAAPDGRLWIRRTPTAARPRTSYDVVDRRGGLAAQLTLGAAERIIGFGRDAAYSVVTDGDGIERVRRHPMPVIP